MAVFLNKKEQVFDLQLTPYGKRLLSNGKFVPVYYTFLDDNVLYDGQYAGVTESQNDIHKRIKEDTQYLEGLVQLHNVETSTLSTLIETGPMAYYESDINPLEQKAPFNDFKFNDIIGDAFLDADTNKAPGWKIVSLGGSFLSSSFTDARNALKVPQINIELNYVKEVVPYNYDEIYRTKDIKTFIYRTQKFKDNNMIQLVPDDLVLYVEELNTMLLTENFDIEVYEVTSGSTYNEFERKYFPTEYSRFEGGAIDEGYINMMRNPYFDPDTPYLQTNSEDGPPRVTLLSSSVEYFFNILTDRYVEKDKACKGKEIFDKRSYYIDIDFDCSTDNDNETAIYSNIYGPVTEPDICQ
jgi:hypothetical protein